MRNKNFFKDVKNVEPQGLQGKIGGSPYLNNLLSLRIGVGTQIFAANYQGMWAGSDKFDTAPFSVNMAGHVKATSAEFPGLVTISIFKQDLIPTSLAIGDLWFDTNDANKLYRAGSAGATTIASGKWELVRDTDIAQALSDASNAQSTADSKVKTFLQDAIPTSISIGDIWIDTNDSNKQYRAASVGATTVGTGAWEAVSTIGITIFAQDAIPTSTAIGDLWYDTNDGNKQYRAASVGADAITAGEWELVSTMGITVFAQDGVPTSLAVGDLWYDTNDNNKPYRAASVGADAITAGEWEAVDDQRAADAILKAGTTQVLTGDIQIGESNVKIDGANKRIVINDGTRDIILIGYQSGGF